MPACSAPTLRTPHRLAPPQQQIAPARLAIAPTMPATALPVHKALPRQGTAPRGSALRVGLASGAASARVAVLPSLRARREALVMMGLELVQVRRWGVGSCKRLCSHWCLSAVPVCPIGSYSTDGRQCLPCAVDRTTSSAGATSAAQCVCESGLVENGGSCVGKGACAVSFINPSLRLSPVLVDEK